MGTYSGDQQQSTTTSGISGIAGNQGVRTGDTTSAGTLVANWNTQAIVQDVQAQARITQQFGSAAAQAWANYSAGKYREAINNGDEEGAACWAPDGVCRASGHAILGGITYGAGGAVGAAASSISVPALNQLLIELGLPAAAANGLALAFAAGLGATVGGVGGVAGATNEAANNALLSYELIQSVIEKGGWETIRACLASPNCVSILGTETAAHLYVGLNVTDSIESATRGMPDISNRSANERNLQGTGGAIGAQAFFDNLPIDQSSLSRKPNGAQVAILTDGSTVGYYPTASSTGGPTIQINRPNGSRIKVRF